MLSNTLTSLLLRNRDPRAFVPCVPVEGTLYMYKTYETQNGHNSSKKVIKPSIMCAGEIPKNPRNDSPA